MVALAFDTHEFVKELTSVGFTEAQAEAVTSVVKRTRAVELDELATKADLLHLAAKADVADAKAELLKWVTGLIGFQFLAIAGSMAGLLKLFLK